VGRLVAAAEIVMAEMQGDGRAVIFQLFAKPVRQTGEPAHGTSGFPEHL
jgi:hypothetical protein